MSISLDFPLTSDLSLTGLSPTEENRSDGERSFGILGGEVDLRTFFLVFILKRDLTGEKTGYKHRKTEQLKSNPQSLDHCL